MQKGHRKDSGARYFEERERELTSPEHLTTYELI